MGMDFVALMKYGGPDERVVRALDYLEAESPEEIRVLARRMQERGFACGREEAAVWEYWRKPELHDPGLDLRPSLPSLETALHLPEDFFLTFGSDAIQVYHLLRWHFFLTDAPLQQAMLDACSCIASLFGATDCVLTSDFSPVVHAFRDGESFNAALASAGPEDGERPLLADLYIVSPQDYVIRERARADGKRQTQHRAWDRDQPPPKGWERATTWDSKGYWRFPVNTGLRGYLAPQSTTARPPHRARKEMDEARWTSSAEPKAMLESLLRGDSVSLRKVRLWACACVRRVLPLFVTEHGRRAVDAIERFADGRARQREVEELGGAAQRVRKGSSLAKRAIGLASQLCAPELPFPPSNASEAAADAVAKAEGKDSSGVAERAFQAGLLRDIFGPLPFRSIPLEESWLHWNDSCVTKLATAIYEGRRFEEMPILADALEEAGSANLDLLTHCREQREHVRGCWVLDLLLGKK